MRSIKSKTHSGTSKFFKVPWFSSAPNHRILLCSDTAGRYPDTLIIESPVVVTLDGIIFLSYDDGVPVDFTVDTNDGSGWTQGANITGNTEVLQFIKFPRSLRCLQLRVNVTLAQNVAYGEFTRIAELSPVYADLSSSVPTITVTASIQSSTSLSSTTRPSSTTTTTTATPSPTTITTTAPSTNSKQSENTTTIVAGVLGAIAGVLILALIVVVLLMRRRRNKNGGSTPPIDTHYHHSGPPSSSGGAKIFIPPSLSYAPDLTTGSGEPVTLPPPPSSSYPPDHYSNMGSTAFNTLASPQSHSLSMATTIPTPIHPLLSSSYPGPIFGADINNRRPTEVSGTDFVIELSEGRAREVP